jgi:hypothetical protein
VEVNWDTGEKKLDFVQNTQVHYFNIPWQQEQEQEQEQDHSHALYLELVG